MSLNIAKATVVLNSLTAKFDKAAIAATPFYPSIATIAPSDGEDEDYGWIGDMPGMREWLGERKYHELSAATYSLKNKHWESSLSIPKTKIADDRMGMFPPMMESLAARATYHPDELLFTTLINGESELCFDGKTFFATDHAWGDSGSQSNDLSYTVTDAAAVTVTEMKAAIRQAVNKLISYKDDKGNFVNSPTFGRLNDLVLLVPLALRDQAFDALESQLLGGGNTNVIIDKPQIVSSPHLTSSVKFYLFRTGQPLKPFVFQPREPLSRQMKGLNDIETKEVKFLTEARYNLGYLFWQYACLTTLAE